MTRINILLSKYNQFPDYELRAIGLLPIVDIEEKGVSQ